MSLRCQLNQSYPNLSPIMPLDFQFVNAMILEPLLCHLNHWDANQLRFQLMSHFVSFQQSVTVPLECHCVTGPPLTVQKIFKNDPLAEVQDRKGTPFENFRRASRPIRSQDSELSTNRRPRFQENSRHQPNFYCVTEVPLNHCCVTGMPTNHSFNSRPGSSAVSLYRGKRPRSRPPR